MSEMSETNNSRLAEAIIPVLERMAARALTLDERGLLQAILLDLGLAGPAPPEWMLALFEDILAGRGDQGPRNVPTDDAAGEIRLANILCEITSQILDLGVDDQGEAVQWAIPACGVTVFISRETSTPGFHSLEILPYPEREPDPELLRAIAQNDTQLAKKLLAQGANPNQSYSNMASPLILAIHCAPELVPVLLAHGADPNAVGICGSPLILAASRHDLSSVAHLLAQGANPNLRLEKPGIGLRQETALLCALDGAESPEQLAVVEKLKQAGAVISTFG